MRISPRSMVALIVGALACLSCGQLHAGMVYLALGDSNAFGDDESTPSSLAPNFGDQGYVRPFGDFLGALSGGVRPRVVNLAISGELATSFFTGTAPANWPFRAPQLNLNYPNPTTSQFSLMLGTLDAARAAGDSVIVTLNIGSNDFRLLVSTPTFQAATPFQQQAAFGNLVNQVAGNYQTILTQIQVRAPGTRVLLPGFFNSLLPSDPTFGFNELATSAANQTLQQLAPAFGATYVDFQSIIRGRATEFANLTGPGHLNQAGYAAVARALNAAVVPEPSSVLMLSLGVAGLVMSRRRMS